MVDKPQPVQQWRWGTQSPFVQLLYRKHKDLQKSWNFERVQRLCCLGRFTFSELCVFVGAIGKNYRHNIQANGKIDLPVVLNLQRLEDYVIHRRLKVPPKIRFEDAILIKVMNRQPEKEKEAA